MVKQGMATELINPVVMERLFSGPVKLNEINALPGGPETLGALKLMGMKITEAAGYCILEKAVEVGSESSEASPASAETGAASPAPASSSPAVPPATEAPEDEEPETGPEEIPESLKAAYYFKVVDMKLRTRKGTYPKLELFPADEKAAEVALKLTAGLTEGRVIAVGMRLALVSPDGKLAALPSGTTTAAEPGIAEAGTGQEGTGTAPGPQVKAETAEGAKTGLNPAPETAPETTAAPQKAPVKEKSPQEIKKEIAGLTAEGALSPSLAAGMSGLLE